MGVPEPRWVPEMGSVPSDPCGLKGKVLGVGSAWRRGSLSLNPCHRSPSPGAGRPFCPSGELFFSAFLLLTPSPAGMAVLQRSFPDFPLQGEGWGLLRQWSRACLTSAKLWAPQPAMGGEK